MKETRLILRDLTWRVSCVPEDNELAKLALPDVTLCAVTSINYELTVRAMRRCLEQCSFADVVLIAGQPVDAPFRVEVVPPFRGIDYAPLVCRTLTHYTSSAYNLLVQYDGYIVDASAWSDAFYDYDFIGAKWPWHIEGRRVGNSGFCLRSKKLLDIMAEMPLPNAGEFFDDTYFCHTVRAPLEKNHGIKFATEAVADEFAYERHRPEAPTFGFHGMFNFWRYTDDQEMQQICGQLDDLYVTWRPYAEILFYYYDARKFPVFSTWYRRIRQRIGKDQMQAHLLQYVKDAAFVAGLVDCGERLFLQETGEMQRELRQSA